MPIQRLESPFGIRHSLDYLRNPLGFLETLQQSAGDIAALRIFGHNALVLYHPRHIEQVLTVNASRYVKGFRAIRQQSPFGKGLLMSDGPLWQRQRRMVQQIYVPRVVRPTVQTMAAASVTRAQTWKDGATLDLLSEMSQLSLAVFLQTLLGPDSGHEVLLPILERLSGLFQAMTARPVPIPLWVPTPGNLQMVATLGALDDAIGQAIAHRRATPGDDLLSALLQVEDGDGPMTTERLHDEVKSLFIAGHETNALALCYALWLLAQHPEIQDDVAQEAQMAGDGEPGKLVKSARVIYETMRLYPPVHALVREAVADDVIDDTPVRAGTQVVLPQWSVQRDERWWPQPLRFDPSRWETNPAPRQRFSYFPFGGGERLCVGQHFAVQMLTIALSAILKHHRLERVTPEPLVLHAGITLRPNHPVFAKVFRRPGV